MGCSHSDIFPDVISTNLQIKDIEGFKQNSKFEFTQSEVNLIQTSWNRLGNQKELGMMIMIK